MKPFDVDDIVSVINQKVTGKVLKSDSSYTTIEDTDGFTLKFQTKNLVLASQEEKYSFSGLTIKDSDLKPAIKETLNQDKEVKKISILPEIDLHFEALENKIYLESHYQILQKQLTACKAFIKKAIDKKYKKVVIIHGKGEGILKAEIHLYLNRLIKDGAIHLTYQDASPDDYGYGGATEVTFQI